MLIRYVPQSLAEILSERQVRTRLGLSKFAAEAAEEAAEHSRKLSISKNVKDVAAVHTTIFPEPTRHEILNIGILTGEIKVKRCDEGATEKHQDGTESN